MRLIFGRVTLCRLRCLLRAIFGVCDLRVGVRQVIHFQCDRSPSDAFGQQLREASPFGQTPSIVAIMMGIRRALRNWTAEIEVFAHPVCAHGQYILRTLHGSLRRECLDLAISARNNCVASLRI